MNIKESLYFESHIGTTILNRLDIDPSTAQLLDTEGTLVYPDCRIQTKPIRRGSIHISFIDGLYNIEIYRHDKRVQQYTALNINNCRELLNNL